MVLLKQPVSLKSFRLNKCVCPLWNTHVNKVPRQKSKQRNSLVPMLEGAGSIFIMWDSSRHTEAQRKPLSKPSCCCFPEWTASQGENRGGCFIWGFGKHFLKLLLSAFPFPQEVRNEENRGPGHRKCSLLKWFSQTHGYFLWHWENYYYC